VDPSGTMGTFLTGISDIGAVTGFYYSANNSPGAPSRPSRGFSRKLPGGISRFDPSGSAYTEPQSINQLGTVTGFYVNSNYQNAGFLWSPNGPIMPIEAPGASQTTPLSINNVNQITGYINDAAGTAHGFVAEPQ
jgi:hypothetical protein